MFEIILFFKKAEKKVSQFMRFKFTNFINQNGLDKLVEKIVCKYKGKNEHFIQLGHRRYKNGDNEGTTSKGHSHRITVKNEEHRKVQRRIRKKGGNIFERRREQVITIIIYYITISSGSRVTRGTWTEKKEVFSIWIKTEVATVFFPLLSGGVEQRVIYLLELSVDSKKLRR